MNVCMVGTCTFGNFGKRIFEPERAFVKETLEGFYQDLSLLESYYFLSESKDFPYMKKVADDKLNIFLDSGAFSAYSKGVDISLGDYGNFIKQNADILTAYANLDVIGDPRKTWINQVRMEKMGLNPIPTYHYGEDPKWLRRYLDKGYDYIALGGMVPISTRDLTVWLDKIWTKYLIDKDGMPIVKVHGFGMTVFKLMFRYPWYSIDSTTWVLQAAMGQIYVPVVRKGDFCYTVPPMSITVTNRSRHNKEHINNVSPMIRERALKYIADKGFCLGVSRFRNRPVGYKPKKNERWTDKPTEAKVGIVETILKEGLTNLDIHRKLFNCMYFYDLQRTFPAWPWPLKKNKIRTYGMFT